MQQTNVYAVRVLLITVVTCVYFVGLDQTRWTMCMNPCQAAERLQY